MSSVFFLVRHSSATSPLPRYAFCPRPGRAEGIRVLPPTNGGEGAQDDRNFFADPFRTVEAR